MKIIFNNKFYNSDYANDGSSGTGRMEAIIDKLKEESGYEFVNCFSADLSDINLVHTPEYISKQSQKPELFEMAVLSAGGAIKASQLAMENTPAFACIRPPGHHAYKNQGWGYCVFSNMAISLQKLRAEKRIESAIVIDFDAHTGDGTIDCLADWKECKILNPMEESRLDYIKSIELFLKDIKYVDIIGVCAGFDSYELDLGRKLKSFDFYQIGALIKFFSKKIGHNRRFALLEGGYYLPDLGKNVLSFCNGFE